MNKIMYRLFVKPGESMQMWRVLLIGIVCYIFGYIFGYMRCKIGLFHSKTK